MTTARWRLLLLAELQIGPAVRAARNVEDQKVQKLKVVSGGAR